MCSSNFSEFYSQDTYFESLPDYQLSWVACDFH